MDIIAGWIGAPKTTSSDTSFKVNHVGVDPHSFWSSLGISSHDMVNSDVVGANHGNTDLSATNEVAIFDVNVLGVHGSERPAQTSPNNRVIDALVAEDSILESNTSLHSVALGAVVALNVVKNYGTGSLNTTGLDTVGGNKVCTP